MKRRIIFWLCVCSLLAVAGGSALADAPDSAAPDGGAEGAPAAAAAPELRNYIGCTPTFVLMGMYGLVYARALNNNVVLTAIAGYTNFDLSPFPFLRNENYVFQNVYGGINVTFFPFSDRMFPRGFYFGFDFTPTVGFTTNRSSGAAGTAIGLSGDVLVGWSWIFGEFLKLSVDVFLNANTSSLHLSGENWDPEGRWVFMPFFDINIGIVF